MNPELITWGAFVGGFIIGTMVSTAVMVLIIFSHNRDNSRIKKADPGTFIKKTLAR